jgi:alpha-1,3-glucosyltransferase
MPLESFVKVAYSLIWGVFVHESISKRVYEFPQTIAYVIVDALEKVYLAGFPLLQLFVTLLPILTRKTRATSATGCVPNGEVACPEFEISQTAGGMEFLPLMLTSVYCAVGLVWAFLRLSFIYLKQK